MKYIFTFLLMMALSNMNAQNLQFSQVLTISDIIPPTSSYGTEIISVPDGKIWKIESAYSSGVNWVLNDGGTLIRSISSSDLCGCNSFPIWMKSLDFIKNSGYGSYTLSIIEFTVVP